MIHTEKAKVFMSGRSQAVRIQLSTASPGKKCTSAATADRRCDPVLGAAGEKLGRNLCSPGRS
jgi:hypothetical protein